MNYLEALRDIHTFIFDVDGVMTNGELTLTDDGHQLRKMNIRDGYAIKHALSEGFKVAVISGAYSHGVAARLDYLGVRDAFLGVDDKVDIFEDFVETYKLDPGGILFMGDDLPDYGVMRIVGMPTCPADAVPEIVELSRYVSTFKGGEGCVRDVIEKVLRLQGKWVPWRKNVGAEHSTDE